MQAKQSPEDSDLSTQTFKLPLRFKVSLGITCFALAMIVPIIYLLMEYYAPKVNVIYRTEITMPGGSIFGMAKLQLVDRSLISQADVNYEMFITYPIENSEGRNLQQGSSTPFYLHNMDADTGITIRMSPFGNTSFFVNERQFMEFAAERAEETRQEAKNSSKKMDDKVFYSELGEVFTKALEESTGEKNVDVKFSNLTMAKLKINSNTKNMEFDLDDETKRKLVEGRDRKLFLGSIISFATIIVPKVAGFFVNTVRKYGPLIGKVAGGVIGGVGGFFAGGPVGAFKGAMTGMQIGEAIGSAASSLVNACIPQGSLRISCTPSSIGSVLGQFGGGGGFTGIMNNFIPNGANGPMQGAFDFAKMFGGGGGGSILGGIPPKALSFFGLGSLFG